MPIKPLDSWNARKSFIEEQIPNLMKNNTVINTVSDAKHYLADNVFGVDISQINRWLKDYPHEDKHVTSIVPNIQISLDI